jgi:hypothetical protein
VAQDEDVERTLEELDPSEWGERCSPDRHRSTPGYAAAAVRALKANRDADGAWGLALARVMLGRKLVEAGRTAEVEPVLAAGPEIRIALTSPSRSHAPDSGPLPGRQGLLSTRNRRKIGSCHQISSRPPGCWRRLAGASTHATGCLGRAGTSASSSGAIRFGWP